MNFTFHVFLNPVQIPLELLEIEAIPILQCSISESALQTESFLHFWFRRKESVKSALVLMLCHFWTEHAHPVSVPCAFHNEFRNRHGLCITRTTKEQIARLGLKPTEVMI